MSTRLTTHLRERITNAVLTHRFNEAVEALISDRAAFAEEVYNDVYRKTDREKMAALPEGWLPTEGQINVQFGDHRGYESLDYRGHLYGPLNKARKPGGKADPVIRRALNKHYRHCAKVYDADHRLSKKYEDLQARQKELCRQYDEAKRQVEAAVNSASTINRLVEMWPEVEPFARSFDASPLKVPSIPTDQLNKLLDLPVAA
jgi:hypothetical protein